MEELLDVQISQHSVSVVVSSGIRAFILINIYLSDL